MNEKLKERIIAAAYGDAGLFEKIKIYWIRKNNAEASSIWDTYYSTARRVHKIKPDRFPDQSLEKLRIEMDNTGQVKSKTKPRNSVRFSGHLALLGAGLATAVFLVVFVLRKEPQPDYEGYTEQQVELADKQTREALAIVGRVIGTSSHALKNDILGEKIGLPIHQSMQTVNQLFKEGKKYESVN